MFQGALMPVYCFSLFSPTLTANLGYSAAKAQLVCTRPVHLHATPLIVIPLQMSVPPYVLAALTTVGAGYWSDRVQKRGIVAMTFSALGALGFILLLATHIPGVNYVGLHLAAAGVYPLIPVVVSWGSNNCGGSLKKGVATALIVGFGKPSVFIIVQHATYVSCDCR